MRHTNIYLQIAATVQRTQYRETQQISSLMKPTASTDTTDILKIFCHLFFFFLHSGCLSPESLSQTVQATHLRMTSPTPASASAALCMPRGKYAATGEHAKSQGLHSCQGAHSWLWPLLPALTPITTWVSATGSCHDTGICSWPLQLNVHTPLAPATMAVSPIPGHQNWRCC